MKKVDIAKSLGFSKQYLSKILTGKQKSINEHTLMRLLYFFPDLKYEKIIRYRIIRGDENVNSNNNI